MRNGDNDLRQTGGGGGMISVDGSLAIALEPTFAEPQHLPVVHEPSRYERFVKPVFDRVVGLVLVVCTMPVMLVVALLVLLRLGAPVLLRQPRVGKDGQVFGVYKFRTMRPDRRSNALPVVHDRRVTHKHPNDPRLVGIGRFLRKWSLDELPQLLNVVRGEMSLVGPRPELVTIVARHYAPWQHARHQVKPGVTGLWQVTERGDGEMHEHTLTDLRYLGEVTLRNDLRILLRTIPAALGVNKGF